MANERNSAMPDSSLLDIFKTVGAEGVPGEQQDEGKSNVLVRGRELDDVGLKALFGQPVEEEQTQPVLNKPTQIDPWARSYIQSGYERQAQQAIVEGKPVPEPQNTVAEQFLLGTLNTALFGIPSAALGDFNQETAPRSPVEKIARHAGDFAGLLMAPLAAGSRLTMGLLKRIGAGEVLAGKAAFERTLSKVFGSKIAASIVEGLPLGIASSLVLDERSQENLIRWKEGGLIDELQNRLEAFAMGEFVGARFSWVAQTFDSFTVRAAVNVAVTQLTNVVTAAVEGRSDLLPPIEDIVYQSLLDVYFSRNKQLTPEQIRQFEEKRQEVRDFAKWLADTLELQKFVEEAKKTAKDPVNKGERPKTAVEVTKNTEPLIYLTADEVSAIYGKRPGDQPLELSPRVKYSPEYNELVEYIRTLQKVKAGEKSTKNVANVDAELDAVMWVKDLVEQRAAMGLDEAGVWWQYYKDARRTFPKVDPRSTVFTLEAIRLVADRYGLPADFLNKAGGGKLFSGQQSVDVDIVREGDKIKFNFKEFGETRFTVEASASSAFTEVKKSIFGTIGDSLGLTRSGKKALINSVKKALQENLKVASIPAKTGYTRYQGRFSRVLNRIQGGIDSDPTTPLHEVIHAIDKFLSDSNIENLRGRLKGNNPNITRGEEVAEIFSYTLPAYKDLDIKSVAELRKRVGSALEDILADVRSRSFYFFAGEPDIVLKYYDTIVKDVLGTEAAQRIRRRAQEIQRIYNVGRQKLDPAVYALSGREKTPEARARRIVRQMERRARLIEDLKRSSGKTAKGAARAQRKLLELVALQQRDAFALVNIFRTPVLFDGGKVKPLLPTEVDALRRKDLTKLQQVKPEELSETGRALLDFSTQLLKPGASYDDVMSSFNRLMAVLGAKESPGKGDGLLTTTLRSLETPLYSLEVTKNVAAEFLRGGTDIAPMLSKVAKLIHHEVGALTIPPYQGITSKMVRMYLDYYNEPKGDAKNNITIIPNQRDVNAIAEWVLTPEFALRNFPEAQREVVKLIEAHLVHFRLVEKDKAFFRDTLRFITKNDYPVLREAIKDAYKLSDEALKAKYDARVADAAVKLRDWFKGVREEIKAHLKEVEKSGLSQDAQELLELVADEVDRQAVAKRIVEYLSERVAVDLAAQWDSFLSPSPIEQASSTSGGKFLSDMFKSAGRAFREAVKGDQLNPEVIKSALEELRKNARSSAWNDKLSGDEIQAVVDTVKEIKRLDTVSKLTTELRRLLLAVARRDSKRVLTYVDKILKDFDKFTSAKVRRITPRGKALRLAREVIKSWNRIRDLDNWGVWDYVTRIELGTYKAVNEDGHIIAIRTTRDKLIKAIEEYRKMGIIRPDENISIVNEYSKVDPLAPRQVEGLKGDPDLLRALDAYSYYVRKRLVVVPAINEVSQRIRASDVSLFPPNVRRVINGVIRSLRGQYYFMDRVLDQLITKRGGEPFAFSRGVAFARKITAAAKLGYRVGAFLVNSVFGYGHTWVKTPTRHFIEAFKWMRSLEGRKFIEQEEKYIGIGFVESEGQLNQFIKKFHPLWMYSSAELNIRRHSLAANYLYAKNELKLSEPDAREFARKGVRTQQFLYTLHALPRAFRGPIGRLTLQFRSYMLQEVQFMSTLTPQEWVKYLSLQLAFGGPQAVLHLLHSLPWLDSFGLLDKIERGLQSVKFPDDWPVIGGRPVAFGLFGLLGFDISMAAAIQLPGKVEEWFGAFVADAIKLFNTVRDTMRFGVRYGMDTGKINDRLTGIKWLSDRVGQTVVIAKYWSDALEAVYTLKNGDIWVRDARGRRLYPLRGYYDVALLAMGLKPIQKAQLESLLNVWYNEQDRKEEFRRKVLDQAVWYLAKGKPFPPELVEDILVSGLTPEGLVRAWRSAELDPETRVLMLTRYLDRINYQERMFLRDLWDSYLEGRFND